MEPLWITVLIFGRDRVNIWQLSMANSSTFLVVMINNKNILRPRNCQDCKFNVLFVYFCLRESTYSSRRNRLGLEKALSILNKKRKRRFDRSPLPNRNAQRLLWGFFWPAQADYALISVRIPLCNLLYQKCSGSDSLN